MIFPIIGKQKEEETTKLKQRITNIKRNKKTPNNISHNVCYI